MIESQGSVERGVRRNDWVNETNRPGVKEAAVDFLKKYSRTGPHNGSPEGAPLLAPEERYVRGQEFSVTGDYDVIDAMAEGTASIREISVLYKDDEPVQVHVVANTDGTEKYADAYILHRPAQQEAVGYPDMLERFLSQAKLS